MTASVNVSNSPIKETLQPQAQANHRHAFDVVIVGSGGAGLSLALSLPSHLSIAVLAKDKLTEASTFYAQGGVAAVLSDDDSVDEHVDDTLIAGAGLCHENAVRFTVEHSREAVEFLLKQGVKFTLDENETLHLTREGGHSKRRIIHAADATGVAISTSLAKRVKQCPNVKLFEYVAAIDVITTHKLSKHNYSPISEPNRAVGLYALDLNTNQVITFTAPFIALACGGASKAYLYTSNPDIATGDSTLR